MSETLPKVGIGYSAGKLTVIQATTERKAGYTVWSCRCECGNEIMLDTRCLQRRTVSDCGCITKVKVDLTGRRFSRLVCIEPTDERMFNGSTVWKCICNNSGSIKAQTLTWQPKRLHRSLPEQEKWKMDRADHIQKKDVLFGKLRKNRGCRKSLPSWGGNAR